MVANQDCFRALISLLVASKNLSKPRQLFHFKEITLELREITMIKVGNVHLTFRSNVIVTIFNFLCCFHGCH